MAECPSLPFAPPAISEDYGPSRYHPSSCDGLPDQADDGLLMRTLNQLRVAEFLPSSGTRVSGWTQVAYTASSVSDNQLPLGFNDRANDFLLQQNWLRIERSVETDAGRPSFGFLIDTILPGSDYRFTAARGLLDDQTGLYGFDPVQFYSQIYLPHVGQGLDIKIGRFFGQYGVESIAGVETPFVSRAYNFIYNPFTHTGLLTTLQLNEQWSVQHGIVTGSDVFLDSAAEPTYIGSIQWASSDQRTSLQLAKIFGSGQFNQAENFANPRVFDLVLTRKLTDELTCSWDLLYGYQTDVPGIGTADWYGFVNYLTYQWSSRWTGRTRLEFFDDADGNRTGFAGLYTAITAGVAYQPSRSVLLRPEIRYDHNDSSEPFEGRSGLLTAAYDVIVRW